MRLQWKLFFLILAVAGSATTVALYLSHNDAEQRLLAESRAKVLSIAASTAALMDGDVIAQVTKRELEESEQYKVVKKQLQHIRDANRRDDTWVANLYTVYQAKEHPELTYYGIDSEADPALISHVGDVVRRVSGQVKIIDAYEADSVPTTDEWGVWLGANAPIRNSAGQIVGAVVAEIPYQGIQAQMRSIDSIQLQALIFATCLAAFVALFSARIITRKLDVLKEAAQQIGNGVFPSNIAVRGSGEVAALARAMEQMSKGLQERERVKSAFARYVSHDILDRIITLEEAPTISGVRKRITVLFSDIRDFTTLTEHMKPEEVVVLLNAYFEKMVDIIFRNKGTLDKFLGDGLMAIFGAPCDDAFQEEHALRAAVEMERAVSDLRKEFTERGFPQIAIGIGIHSGSAIVGNIGSSKRIEYTAIGDVVNVASRLENATKELRANIVVSDSVASSVQGTFTCVRIGEITVKGRVDPVVVHTVKV